MSKVKKIIIGFCLLLIVYYLMVITTDNIKDEFFQYVLKEEEVENDSDNNYIIFHRYKVPDGISYNDIKTSLIRVFAIHDFKRGFIYVHYKIVARNNDEIVFYSATRFPFYLAKWEIEKINGEWKVTKIYDSP